VPRAAMTTYRMFCRWNAPAMNCTCAVSSPSRCRSTLGCSAISSRSLIESPSDPRFHLCHLVPVIHSRRFLRISAEGQYITRGQRTKRGDDFRCDAAGPPTLAGRNHPSIPSGTGAKRLTARVYSIASAAGGSGQRPV
jgi:hypothetical protein